MPPHIYPQKGHRQTRRQTGMQSEPYQGCKEHVLSNCVWQLHLREPSTAGAAYELIPDPGLQFSWRGVSGGEWMEL